MRKILNEETATTHGEESNLKYKVNFSGSAYVEANDEEEAKDRFLCENIEFEEYEITDVKLVDDFCSYGERKTIESE